MPKPHIVFDIETVPDYAAIARAHHLPETDIDGAKAILGEAFPKPTFHKIVCISALGAVYDIEDKSWRVHEWASLHTADRSEADVISEFLRMTELTMPVLISFNGLHFDLPVVKARAMLHRLSAPHLSRHNYFSSFSDLHIDMCEQLGVRGRDRMRLDEACLALGLKGKMDGMQGSLVADLVDAGRFDDIAEYCSIDVSGTYSLFLLREVFAGRLDGEGCTRSLALLQEKLAWMLKERPTTFVQT